MARLFSVVCVMMVLILGSEAQNYTNTTTAAYNSTVAIITTQLPKQTPRAPNYNNRIDDVFDLDHWERNRESFGNGVFGYLDSQPDERSTLQQLLFLAKIGSGNGLPLTTQLMKGYFNMLPNYLRSPSGGNVVKLLGGLTEKDLEDEVLDNYYHHKEKNEVSFTSLYSKTQKDALQKAWLVDRVDWRKIILGALIFQPYDQYAPDGVNQTCYGDAVNLLQSFYMAKDWAIDMFDATGKPPIGIKMGNLNWIGQYDMCHTIVGKRIAIPSGDVVDEEAYRGSYCHVEMPLPPSLEIPSAPGQKLTIRLGVCFPSSCASNDVKLILDQLKTAAFGESLPAISKARCHSSSPEVTGEFSKDTIAIVASIMMALVAAWVVFCSIVEGLFWYEPAELNDLGVRSANSKSDATPNAPNITLYFIKDNDDTAYYKPTDKLEMTDLGSEGTGNGHSNGGLNNGGQSNGSASTQPRITGTQQEGVVKRLIKVYSLYTNVPALLSAKQPKGAIKTLDALRVFNMNWIILGHIFSIGAVFQPHTMSNGKLAAEKIKDWTFMGVFTGMLAVDSFFFISGLLVSYLFLKACSKNNGKWGRQMVMYYVHRFIRILPLYVVIICVYVAFGKYLGSGPMFDWEDKKIQNCNANWWTNLLFINNFVDPVDMCLGWSWYLSNDMQFYVIAPLILIPLYLKAVYGLLLLLAVFILHFSITAFLWAGTEGRSYLQDPNIFYDAYITPYCRIGPYLIGLLLGWIFYKGYKLPTATASKRMMSTVVVLICWAATIAMLGTIVYVQHEDVKEFGVAKPGWNTLQRTAYETTSRTAWAVCLAWIVYACNYGYGGFVYHILSWKGWGPLGKLTFSVYLVHPLVIFIYLSNRRDLNYVEDFSVAYMYSAYVILSYIGGGVLSLVFEWPSSGLEKLVFGKARKPSSK